MAARDGRRNGLRPVIVVTILSLLLLALFTVYYVYVWKSPHLYTKGLIFTPSPMLSTDCKNDSFHRCPCTVSATITPKDGNFDNTKCPLDQPFAVYVYRHEIVPLKYPSDVIDIEVLLKETNSWTDIPSKACLFVCVVGPLPMDIEVDDMDRRLDSLPYWNSGINHVLIDIPEVGQKPSAITNFSSILVANGLLLDLNLLHILTPPVPYSQIPIVPPPLYQSVRAHILYFEGQSSTSVPIAWLDPDILQDLKFNVKFTCKHPGGVIRGNFGEEWGLCTPQDQRLRKCTDSMFTLVLVAPYASAITYTRLTEALRCGAVPVIVGARRLPFDSVINWNKAAILLPKLISPHALSSLLTSFQPETIIDYRRQGRFLHETYFSSRKAVLYTISAILRSRFMHPPPPAEDFKGRVFKVNDDVSKIPPSPRFRNNYTIYSEDLWNNPPGPFLMYPVTPYRPPYVPSMYNKPANNSQGYSKPPVLKGKPFRSSLHGIYPSEGFTVVALTYHRSQHLAEFVKGFEGCSFLAKIVIVWNDEKEPDKSFKLPNIGVPIEIVTAGKNSLNNRFLPFSNIETEAILAIDDDQKIPLGEIQLAFRVWRENRDRIIGWYDRFVYWNPEEAVWYYSWDVSCEPSLALTGAAFYHKYYNYLYSYWMPQSIRDVVDTSMNGEDLAMNFLISYISRKPPMKVDSKTNLHGCSNCGSSISTHHNHLAHRSKCVNEFVRIWGHNSLLGTQFRTEPALKDVCLTDM